MVVPYYPIQPSIIIINIMDQVKIKIWDSHHGMWDANASWGKWVFSRPWHNVLDEPLGSDVLYINSVNQILEKLGYPERFELKEVRDNESYGKELYVVFPNSPETSFLLMSLK